MPTRCLNKVTLIGNLTRDVELRYTPGGMAVASFGVATNRSWTTKQGERKEDAQFHRIVSWNKLAELCSQLLSKGMRVYVEGRLQYREWTGQDEQKRQVAEIVIGDMVVLSPNRNTFSKSSDADVKIQTSNSGKVDDGIEDIVIPDEDIDLGDSKTVVKKEVKEDKKEKVVEKVKEKSEDGDMPF
jgi:single-strand DNA-binding protein